MSESSELEPHPSRPEARCRPLTAYPALEEVARSRRLGVRADNGAKRGTTTG
jgi:hypothetical protein